MSFEHYSCSDYFLLNQGLARVISKNVTISTYRKCSYESLNVCCGCAGVAMKIFWTEMWNILFIYKIQYRIQIRRTQGALHFATQQGAGCTWPINWRLAAKYFVSQLFLPCLWQSCILRMLKFCKWISDIIQMSRCVKVKSLFLLCCRPIEAQF